MSRNAELSGEADEGVSVKLQNNDDETDYNLFLIICFAQKCTFILV